MKHSLAIRVGVERRSYDSPVKKVVPRLFETKDDVDVHITVGFAIRRSPRVQEVLRVVRRHREYLNRMTV